ncbi:selenide, water dikinase SelD [Boseongicola aestuarii]|uniref:Selenide, water dikinase n=1 Tax=Boseongicola aestuarii TaxID=1470561 RepID=A0A238J0Z4_9RHOB|nr:selenide, water dikinase SelD [Boseongicola aestuarii]SMX23845.1 Selenide, water dikinase [Boseongicola aestuarii]
MNTILPLPLVSDVVLIGGGHAHALLLRRWGMKPIPGARLTLINPGATAPYTGMLPGFVAGHYGRQALEIDLIRLARFAGARMIFGAATGIDRTAKQIFVPGRPPISYDIASLDIGITSHMAGVPGFADHAIAAKPLGPFAEEWQAFVEKQKKGPVCVIGGGVAGVELALAMHHRLEVIGAKCPVTVIEANKILGGTSAATSRKLKAAMSAAGIAVIEGANPIEIRADHLKLSDGRSISCDFAVGAAGARPFPWLAETGLQLTNGYVSVDDTLRSVNDASIYAVGDCADLSHAPRPKAGVFAVRAAPVLTENIRADLTGSARKRFVPQMHYLKLVSLGKKSAVADKYALAASGEWAWRWKDLIDRRFMDRLNAPPQMASPDVPKGAAKGVRDALGVKPICGGCGSKVGASVLDEALAQLDFEVHPDIAKSTGDDAAIINIGKRQQVISTDHLRAFWDDPYLMTRIAALHAMGDVWAMGAKPQAMLAQITLPRMSEDLQTHTLREILAATQDISREIGAPLVGGHTTQGAELTLGFTVTGTLAATAKSFDQARAGDALILTRPIGSGTLMAAEMAGKAAGDHIENVVNVMATSHGNAAEILSVTAHAMTDVTGFGLAGHAQRMAAAAGLTAVLNSRDVPHFPGAHQLAKDGIASTLAPANRAALVVALPNTAAANLLLDPQTAGGFLAAVPSGLADKALESLRDIGLLPAVVGHLKAWSGGPLEVT